MGIEQHVYGFQCMGADVDCETSDSACDIRKPGPVAGAWRIDEELQDGMSDSLNLNGGAVCGS